MENEKQNAFGHFPYGSMPAIVTAPLYDEVVQK